MNEVEILREITPEDKVIIVNKMLEYLDTGFKIPEDSFNDMAGIKAIQKDTSIPDSLKNLIFGILHDKITYLEERFNSVWRSCHFFPSNTFGISIITNDL